MVGVGVVWVVYCWVVAVVFRWGSGDADFRFTDIPGTRGLKPASVILFRRSVGPIVVTVAFVAANHR